MFYTTRAVYKKIALLDCWTRSKKNKKKELKLYQVIRIGYFFFDLCHDHDSDGHGHLWPSSSFPSWMRITDHWSLMSDQFYYYYGNIIINDATQSLLIIFIMIIFNQIYWNKLKTKNFFSKLLLVNAAVVFTASFGNFVLRSWVLDFLGHYGPSLCVMNWRLLFDRKAIEVILTRQQLLIETNLNLLLNDYNQ